MKQIKELPEKLIRNNLIRLLSAVVQTLFKKSSYRCINSANKKRR